MSTRKLSVLIVAMAVLMAGLLSINKLFENLDAGEVMVIQSIGGDLAVHTTPGPKWQGFGKVTKYHLRDQLWFITPQEGETLPPDAKGSPAIAIRFNDGGHADLNGSIAYEIPIDTAALIELHRRYGSQEALENQVVRSMVEKAIYMSGPLMSSTESYASRRNELLGDIEDQVQNGVYQTTASDAKVIDIATGQEKTVKQVGKVVGPDGRPKREQESMLGKLGMKAYNLSVRRVVYDSTVEAQIRKQQESAAAAQQAAIESKTAQQKQLTATAEAAAEQAKLVGAAEAQKAAALVRGQMEVQVEALTALKAQTNAVIAANQKLIVAETAVKEAQAFKESEKLRGEGEAARRAAVLVADGALEKKLEAWVAVQKAYASAFSEYKGQIVPSIVFGSSGGQTNSAGGFDAMLQLIAAKSARDLSLDLSIPSPKK